MRTAVIQIELFVCFISLLAVFILFFINKEQRHTNRLLGCFLLIVALLAFNEFILYSGWYVKFPRLHQLVTPISLLLFPLAFLYMRSILNSEIKFRKYDWLLAIPAVLHMINLMPYYLAPFEQKQAHVLAIYNSEILNGSFIEGYFPSFIFNYTRVAWGILFIVLNFRLINRFKKKSGVENLSANKELIVWLTIFNALLVFYIGIRLFLAIEDPVRRTNSIMLDIALASIVLFICLQLFIRPRLLYGVFSPVQIYYSTQDAVKPEHINTPHQATQLQGEPALASGDGKLNPGIIFSEAQSLRYKKIIDRLFLEKSPFLDADYSLEALVKEIGVSRSTISAFINRQYGMGFREFLNRQRIDYFKNNLDKAEWENLTLEAMAWQCGFSNRNTFIKNFKEIVGETPTEYLRKNRKY